MPEKDDFEWFEWFEWLKSNYPVVYEVIQAATGWGMPANQRFLYFRFVVFHVRYGGADMVSSRNDLIKRLRFIYRNPHLLELTPYKNPDMRMIYLFVIATDEFIAREDKSNH